MTFFPPRPQVNTIRAAEKAIFSNQGLPRKLAMAAPPASSAQ
jgi:hypothetical protein